MTDILDLLDKENPYTAAARRRKVEDAAPAQEQIKTTDPYANNWAVQTARSQAQRTANWAPALSVLGNKLIGDEEGVQAAARRYQKDEEKAERLGPAAQTLDQAKEAGGGVGAYASMAGYQAAGFLPDLAASVVSGGVGGIAGRQIAKGAVRRTLADQIEGRAVNAAARNTAVQTATREAALAAPHGAAGVSNAMKVARAQTDEVARKAALQEAARIAGRTPRLTQAIDTATTVGRVGGAAAGQFPSINTENVDVLAKEEYGQEEAVKALAGTAASSLMGALPVERLFRRFGPAVNKAVRADAEKFLPRVAKEFHKQGLAEGSTEVLQEATQLATHKWIGENIDMLGPDAINQYVVAGLVGYGVGGLLGGGAETGRSAADLVGRGSKKASQAIGDGKEGLTQTIRENLSKHANRIRGREAAAADERPKAGEPMGEPGGGVGEMFRRAKDTVSGAGTYAADAAKGATQRFREQMDDFDIDEQSDVAERWLQQTMAGDTEQQTNMLAERYDAGEPALFEMESSDLSKRFPSELQRLLMGGLPRNSPIWGEQDLGEIAASYERAVRGDSTAQDEINMRRLAEAGVPEGQLEAMIGLGPAMAQAADTRAARALEMREARDELVLEQPDESLRREPTIDEADAGEDLARDWDSGMSAQGPDKLSAIDTYNSLLRTDTGKMTSAERAAHTEQVNAQEKALRDQYIGPAGIGRQNLNVFVEARAKDPKRTAELKREFAAKAKEARYVKLMDPVDYALDRVVQQRPALYDLPRLIQRQFASIRGEGTKNENIPPQQALLRGLAELQSAGIKVDLDSLTPGPLHQQKVVTRENGRKESVDGEWLMDLDAADIAALKSELRGKDAPGTLQRGDAERTDVDGRLTFDDTEIQGESKIDSGDDGEIHARVPRVAPPGVKEGKDSVPTTSNVLEVDTNSPYAKVLADAKYKAAPMTAPKDRARVAFDAGVEIGITEINKQRESGQITERTYNQRMNRLEDPSTGLAMQFFKDARAGKYDTAKVREANADTASPAGHDDIRLPRDVTLSKEAKAWWAQLEFDRKEILGRTPPAKLRKDTPADHATVLAKFEADRKLDLSNNARARRELLAAERLRAKTRRDVRAGRKAAEDVPAKELRERSATPDTRKAKPDPAKRAAFLAKEVKAKAEAKAKALRDGPAVEAKKIAKEKFVPINEPAPKEQWDSVDDIAGNKGGHDLDAETAMLNNVLSEMGINDIRVKVVERTDGAAGSFNRGTLNLGINPRLKGAERVEVLMHEVGHAVLWNEIAKHLPGKWKDVANMRSLQEGIDALAAGNPKLYKNLRADYEKFRDKFDGFSNRHDVRLASAPFRRSQTIQQAKSRLAEENYLNKENKGAIGTDAWANDAHFFHEWVADHIARALTTQKKPLKLVDKFFGKIATAIRGAWNKLTKDGRAQYKPAKSVDKWVRDMFNHEKLAVQQVTGAGVTQNAADAAVASAVRDAARQYDLNDRNDLLAFINEVMRPEERLVLDKYFSGKENYLALRDVYRDNPAALKAMDSAEYGMETRIAMGYMAWKAGGFALKGPRANKAAFSMADDMAKILGLTFDGDLAHRIMTDMDKGVIQRFRDADKAYDARKLSLNQINNRAMRNVQAAINWASKPGPVSEAVSKFWDGQAKRLHDSGVPALRQISALLQRPQGTTGEDRGMIPAITGQIAKFSRQAELVARNLTDRERVAMVSLLQRRAGREDLPTDLGTSRAKVWAAVEKMRAEFDSMYDYMKEAGVDVGKRENFFPIVFDANNPQVRDRLTALYSQPKFEARIRELFADKGAKGGVDKDFDFKGRTVPAPNLTHMEYFEKLRDSAASKHAGGALAANLSIIDTLTHGDIPTIQRTITSAEKRLKKWDDNHEVARFIETEIRYANQRIKELEAAGFTATDKFSSAEQASKDKPAAVTPIEDLVKRLVDGAVREETNPNPDPTGKEAPGFRSLNYQMSAFVYELGDAADRKAFATVQSKDLGEILGRYVDPMVKHTENTRRFGGGENNSAKLDEMLADARAQGATEAQVTEAKNAIKAALGTYGAEGSPVLGMLSTDLAAKFSGKKTRAFIQGAQAYQNVRLLPLAIMSSLVDPMGIAVRTGGDFKTAWTGMRDGMGTIFNKAKREDMHALLETLGAADDMVSMETLNARFGGGGDNAFANKMNSMMFKANGMQGWVRATRYMALSAANGFLLKHAEGKDPASARYLAELNVEPGDVKMEMVGRPDGSTRKQVKLLTDAERAAADADTLAADDRVRSAMMQFVDDAIVRPNSQQMPLWHKDPFMALVVQYKSFAYALYDQIGGRIGVEMKNNNSAVLLAAFAYVPIIIMAELLRGLIQTLGDGQPSHRAGWGPEDYLWLGIERTGLLGPKYEVIDDVKGDMERRRLPGTSQLGPAAGQASKTLDALRGRGNLGKTFEDAMPASAMWKRWNDGRSDVGEGADRAVRV